MFLTAGVAVSQTAIQAPSFKIAQGEKSQLFMGLRTVGRFQGLDHTDVFISGDEVSSIPVGFQTAWGSVDFLADFDGAIQVYFELYLSSRPHSSTVYHGIPDDRDDVFRDQAAESDAGIDPNEQHRDHHVLLEFEAARAGLTRIANRIARMKLHTTVLLAAFTVSAWTVSAKAVSMTATEYGDPDLVTFSILPESRLTLSGHASIVTWRLTSRQLSGSIAVGASPHLVASVLSRWPSKAGWVNSSMAPHSTRKPRFPYPSRRSIARA